MENAVSNTTTEVGGIRIEKSVSTISLDKLFSSDYQKEGTISAQIRQVIEEKRTYPQKQIATDMQDNIFTTQDFGFGDGQIFTSTENRVAWLDVPVNSTKEAVAAKLEAAMGNGACLYRVLSNKPILDKNQKYAIENIEGTTIDTFANSQAVRYPEGAKDGNDNDISGQLTLDPNGKVQYRRVFFWSTPQADVDVRTADLADVYMSPEIAAELSGASVMEGQTL